jgi:hypothetical protein
MHIAERYTIDIFCVSQTHETVLSREIRNASSVRLIQSAHQKCAESSRLCDAAQLVELDKKVSAAATNAEPSIDF